MLENLSIFDKIIFIGMGAILLVFILTIIISRIRYEWKREELRDYWKDCRKKDLFELEKDSTNKSNVK